MIECEHHKIDWLVDTQMLDLKIGERVVGPNGATFIVLSSAAEKNHPVLSDSQYVATLGWPNRVFRERRGRR